MAVTFTDATAASGGGASVASILTRVRAYLQDDGVTQHWSPQVLMQLLNDAMRQLAKDRPDYLLNSSFTLDSVTEVTSESDNTVFPVEAREALAHYTAHLAYQLDEPDKQNMAAAEWHFAQYLKDVRANG